MINKFSVLNGGKYSSSRIFQNYLVFIPAKNTLDISVALLGLNCGNLMECQEKIFENMNKSDSNFASFITSRKFDLLLSPDVNFNGNCLIKNKISIQENAISLYISYKITLGLRFKHRFCIRSLLI